MTIELRAQLRMRWNALALLGRIPWFPDGQLRDDAGVLWLRSDQDDWDRGGHGSPVPDGNDVATCGAVLGMIRKHRKDPSCYMGPSKLMNPDGTSQHWFVYAGNGMGPIGSGDTEIEALLAALESDR